MELSNTYYSLDECIDIDTVMKKLKELENAGKIEYSIDTDILKIDDIDLMDLEISSLENLFDDNDIFPYLDRYDEDEDDLDDYFDDFDE